MELFEVFLSFRDLHYSVFLLFFQSYFVREKTHVPILMKEWCFWWENCGFRASTFFGGASPFGASYILCNVIYTWALSIPSIHFYGIFFPPNKLSIISEQEHQKAQTIIYLRSMGVGDFCVCGCLSEYWMSYGEWGKPGNCPILQWFLGFV